MRNQKMTMDFTVGPILPALIRFSTPIMLTNLLETIYNLVDMAVIGKFIGSVGLSAASVGSDIMHVLTLCFNGFCAGGQVLMAQLTGAKDKEKINSCIGTLFSFMLALALAVTVVMLVCASGLLRLLNTPGEAMDEALVYTLTCYCGIIFIVGYGLLGAILRGMGDSRHPLLFIGVSSVVNVLLDLVFVAVLHLGVFGAALATVIGQGISFVWALLFLYRRRESFGFNFRAESFRIDGSVLHRFLPMAIPMMLQNFATQVSTLYVNSFIYAYGVAITAINGVGTKLATVAHVISNSLVRGGAVMTGQNLSAGKPERIRQVYRFNMLAALVLGVVSGGVLVLLRKSLFGLFTTDAEVLALVDVFTPVVVVRIGAMCARCGGVALVNGIGKPKLNYAIGLVDSLVLRIGLALLLGIVFNMGIFGFWYGNAFGGYGPLLIGGAYFLSGRWEKDVMEKYEALKS